MAEDTGITFSIDGKWLLKLSEAGMEFNKEGFPQFKEDDFVRKFIEILEDQFNVNFSIIDPESNFTLSGST